jgi:hypothetical protein
MTTHDEPTLFAKFWAEIEPTILGEGASKTERINTRTAFLSGANAVLLIARQAAERGDDAYISEAMRRLDVDLKREAGSRWVGPRIQ